MSAIPRASEAANYPEAPRAGNTREVVRQLIREEGFDVLPRPGRSGPPADLVAVTNGRRILVVVVGDGGVDERLRGRLERCTREGETRVYVPLRYRWRALTLLDEWRLNAAALVPY
ncbi:MAG TPA: hypothetical protein VJ397_02505 [Thermoplasmata archaeon]|nr:hypothetical protein [Thermoplasmata archaeon]